MLRRWEVEGRLRPDKRTSGGQRRHDLARLRPEMFRGNINGHQEVSGDMTWRGSVQRCSEAMIQPTGRP